MIAIGNTVLAPIVERACRRIIKETEFKLGAQDACKRTVHFCGSEQSFLHGFDDIFLEQIAAIQVDSGLNSRSRNSDTIR